MRARIRKAQYTTINQSKLSGKNGPGFSESTETFKMSGIAMTRMMMKDRKFMEMMEVAATILAAQELREFVNKSRIV